MSTAGLILLVLALCLLAAPFVVGAVVNLVAGMLFIGLLEEVFGKLPRREPKRPNWRFFLFVVLVLVGVSLLAYGTAFAVRP